MKTSSKKNLKCTVEISLGSNSRVTINNMKLSKVKGTVSTELVNLLREITSEVERKLNEAKAVVSFDNGEDYEIPIKTTFKLRATPYVSGALLEQLALGEEPTIEFDSRGHWTLIFVSRGIKGTAIKVEKVYRLLQATGYIEDHGLTPKGESALEALTRYDLPDHEADTACRLAVAITHPWMDSTFAIWLKARGYLTTDNKMTEEGENWLRSHVKLAIQGKYMRYCAPSLYDLFLKYLPENTLHELYAICADGGHRVLKHALDRYEDEQDEYLKTQPPK